MKMYKSIFWGIWWHDIVLAILFVLVGVTFLGAISLMEGQTIAQHREYMND